MKNLMKFLLFFMLSSFLFTSCSDDENVLKTEKASISFGAVLNDLLSEKAVSKQAVGDLPACSDDDPAYVEIILLQGDTEIIGTSGNPFPINLVNGQIFTEEVAELELDPGTYTLDHFAVYNAGNDLIWLAPRGGVLAEFVGNPLPLSINLGAGVKKYVEVPVLCFDDRDVNEYGYLFFDLDTTEAIEFCIFGNYCDDTGRHYPAAFALSIWTYSNGSPQGEPFVVIRNEVSPDDNGDYAGSTLCAVLPDTEGPDEYFIEITLLNSEAYGDVAEEVIRSGVITDSDVRSLFVGSDANDYYHFREGACDQDDSPNLFDDDLVTESYSNDVVLRWNELVATTMNQKLPQPLEVKNYAMITLAIHDALNNVIPKYNTYALENSAVDVTGLNKENIHDIADAAVSQAARDMLVQLFPAATTAADELLSLLLAEIEDSALRSAGVEIGKDAAAAVFTKRAGDPALGFVSYEGGTEPGEYRVDYMPFMAPNPPVWPANSVYGPNIGDLTPFGIQSSDQFMDEAPYALNSAEYLANYNEVKTLGCNNCPARTSEQSEIGLFWIETSSSILNRITRDVIVQKDLDGWEAARLIALIQMATIDSHIASFEEKFHFDFWRPISAIRAGDLDGVEATVGDATWTPFSPVPTPPNPSFTSSHAYSAGAAAEILKDHFNTDQINLTVISPYYQPGVERHMTSFSQIAFEKGIYGLYIGYDFRHSIEVGEDNGRELGDYLYKNSLTER